MGPGQPTRDFVQLFGFCLVVMQLTSGGATDLTKISFALERRLHGALEYFHRSVLPRLQDIQSCRTVEVSGLQDKVVSSETPVAPCPRQRRGNGVSVA